MRIVDFFVTVLDSCRISALSPQQEGSQGLKTLRVMSCIILEAETLHAWTLVRKSVLKAVFS
jgi:hypothetical protein